MNNMEEYIIKIKDNIENLIENNRLDEAREILQQNEHVFKSDVDVYSIKGIISMMQGNLDEAESVFKHGLDIYDMNFDLNYNIGYLYQYMGKEKLAIKYYKKALNVASSEEQETNVYEMLKTIEIRENKYKLEDDDKNISNIYINEDNCEKPEKTNMNCELDNYKNQFKENLKSLIEMRLLNDAKKMLNEYSNIVKDDIDIFSIRGLISIIEENYDEAEAIMDEGLLIDSTNQELLYNMGYFYKAIGRIEKSVYFYKKLLNLTEDYTVKEQIINTIKALGGKTETRVLIGSPVHQKPQILSEFLQSLLELNKKDIAVDYYFIDDNNIQESSDLLSEFAMKENKVLIHKSQIKEEYVCDNNTHHWKENLVWKVAEFKDRIIDYAKNKNYDYLFFLDSDLILHKDTLIHLISTGKDIISEIFWTKWEQDSVELPQVWLKDKYTQYYVERGENLSRSEIVSRHKQFIEKLKVPGIYEVGGLGACTLISQYALNKGVSFREIKNLSFWGEDRHFCIRASSLGLSLYVDTNYPAYHIYRESDLEGVNKFKNHFLLP